MKKMRTKKYRLIIMFLSIAIIMLGIINKTSNINSNYKYINEDTNLYIKDNQHISFDKKLSYKLDETSIIKIKKNGKNKLKICKTDNFSSYFELSFFSKQDKVFTIFLYSYNEINKIINVSILDDGYKANEMINNKSYNLCIEYTCISDNERKLDDTLIYNNLINDFYNITNFLINEKYNDIYKDAYRVLTIEFVYKEIEENTIKLKFSDYEFSIDISKKIPVDGILINLNNAFI